MGLEMKDEWKMGMRDMDLKLVPSFEEQIWFFANKQVAFLIAGSPFSLEGVVWHAQVGI